MSTFDVIFENIVSVGDLVEQMIQKVDQVKDVARESEELTNSAEELAAQIGAFRI